MIGEWGAGTETKAGAIKCTNVTDCGTNLGNTYGVPVIRRLHNGAVYLVNKEKAGVPWDVDREPLRPEAAFASTDA